MLVVVILITSHTLSVEGSMLAWRRFRKLGVLIIIIIINPWIFSEWITVNMCVSCCGIWVSRCNWQPSLQGLDSVNHSRNITLHPLKCCFSGCLGLVEHLVHGHSSLVERLIHGRGQSLHHVHHLFELLAGHQGVILFLWVLLRWLFPRRHG
jgi:hypothetical protein